MKYNLAYTVLKTCIVFTNRKRLSYYLQVGMEKYIEIFIFICPVVIMLYYFVVYEFLISFN